MQEQYALLYRLDNTNVPSYLKINKWLGIILAALLGMAALLLPVIGIPPSPDKEEYFLPIVLTAIGHSSWDTTFPLLVMAGFIPAYISLVKFWEIPMVTIATFIVWLFLDVVDAYVFDRIERHNLLPFELILYGLYSMPGMLGAFIAKLLQLGIYGAKLPEISTLGFGPK